MMGRPEWKQSSIAACAARYLGSGNASRMGIPRASRLPWAINSSLHHSMTCAGPRNSPTAPIRPLSSMTARMNDRDDNGLSRAMW